MGEKIALMLPGGGARGSYQIGVLAGISEIVGGMPHSPFRIITGTSAGAINAGVLASHAHEFDYGIQRLDHFWRNMKCSTIYRTDWGTAVKSGLRAIAAIVLGRFGYPVPNALLDTRPLRRLLERETRLEGVGHAIANGYLDAVATSVSSYATGRAVTLFQGLAQLEGWNRLRSEGRRAPICVDHLLASAALPLLFPPIRVGNEYFGDGGLRQTAPLSPAILLGADRILVVGTRDEKPDAEPRQKMDTPTLGDVAGHMMDIVFMDNLQADIFRVDSVNKLIAGQTAQAREACGLKPVRIKVIRPSRDVRAIADDFLDRMPGSVVTLLSAFGAWRKGGRMSTYLLFDAGYCGELIDLGRADALARADEIADFMATEA